MPSSPVIDAERGARDVSPAPERTQATSAALGSGLIEMLGPRSSSPRRVSRASVAFAFALVVGADVLVALMTHPFARVLQILLVGTAVLVLARAVMLVEVATFLRLRPRPASLRLGLTLALVLVPPPVAFLVTAYANIILQWWIGIATLAPLVLLLTVLTFSLAALGTAIVVAIDTFTSIFRPVLRVRVLAAVLALGALAFTLSMGSAVAALAVRVLVDWSEGTRLQSGLLVDPELLRALFQVAHDNELLLIVAVHIAGFLLALPAAVSAIEKVSLAVDERIEPIVRGFRAVTAGRRDVAIEIGGPRDMSALAASFNDLVVALKGAEEMERAFGTYVSPAVLTLIRRQHGKASIEASSRVATVLFADIRAFTAMSERLEPQVVLNVLNRYYDRVVAIVENHRGYLDKFIGDAVVVVWNGPIDQEDHAARAIACAVAIQKEVQAMNRDNAFPEAGALQVGIGIATGPMVAGNIGCSTKMEYTVIGDTVNLAARLCGRSPEGAVWVNAACAFDARRVDDKLVVTALPQIEVKGKAKPITPYRAWPLDETAASTPDA
jgi:class 3 adenylate cyclase